MENERNIPAEWAWELLRMIGAVHGWTDKDVALMVPGVARRLEEYRSATIYSLLSQVEAAVKRFRP
jgi:hypothetical protein